MERKNRNPNSHKLRKQTDPSKSWSELPADLLNSICDRLGFADFQRAKSVCSSWYSPLRHSMSKRQIPWLILLPNQYNKHYWCTLFNPEEDKLYKTQDLGVQFAMCVCIANYGSWLLMRYPLYSLYIVNPFTKERIDLPPVELQLGTIKIQGTFDDKFLMSDDHDQWECEDITIRSPVFWIDERTKDYVVLWGLGVWCVVYAKKGDNSWKQIPGTSDCFDMVYKDHKLYFSSSTRSMLKIFDFSGENPQEIFQCGVTVNKFDAELYHEIDEWWVLETKLVVTVTGNVLKVEKMLKRDFDWVPTWSFRVYKVYSRGVYTKDEPVSSLGDEAMLFDLGITMLANDIEGFKKNSIYSIMCSPETNTTDNKTAIRVFNLETQKMEPLLEFDCLSPQQLDRALWIIPNFNPKCF